MKRKAMIIAAMLLLAAMPAAGQSGHWSERSEYLRIPLQAPINLINPADYVGEIYMSRTSCWHLSNIGSIGRMIALSNDTIFVVWTCATPQFPQTININIRFPTGVWIADSTGEMISPQGRISRIEDMALIDSAPGAQKYNAPHLASVF